MWYTPIAVGTVVVVGLIVSYLTRPLKPHEVDPKLIIPVSDVCCCCLPKRIRDWLRCGIRDGVYLDDKVCFYFSFNFSLSFIEKKIHTSIELSPPSSSATLHTSPSSQTVITESGDIGPIGTTRRRTIDGTYDNPAMITTE